MKQLLLVWVGVVGAALTSPAHAGTPADRKLAIEEQLAALKVAHAAYNRDVVPNVVAPEGAPPITDLQRAWMMTDGSPYKPNEEFLSGLLTSGKTDDKALGAVQKDLEKEISAQKQLVGNLRAASTRIPSPSLIHEQDRLSSFNGKLALLLVIRAVSKSELQRLAKAAADLQKQASAPLTGVTQVAQQSGSDANVYTTKAQEQTTTRIQTRTVAPKGTAAR